jgi:hypothetical protein
MKEWRNDFSEATRSGDDFECFLDAEVAHSRENEQSH